jgi:hypothetical protein
LASFLSSLAGASAAGAAVVDPPPKEKKLSTGVFVKAFEKRSTHNF